MPSSVQHPARTATKPLPDQKTGKKTKARRPEKELFGLLSGWSIDSQALSDELKD